MNISSAPGKVILFGEHAVVFGEPALAAAIDMRTDVHIEHHDKWLVNGASPDSERHKYVLSAIEVSKVRRPVSIRIRSDIPEGSGMGSSAAVTVAALGALYRLNGSSTNDKIAQDAFEVEHMVQGRASPIDTTTSVHGHGILVLKEEGEGFLWMMKKGERRWYLHHCDIPPMTLVVGHTGIGAATGPLVARVKEYADRDVRARDMISEIGQITMEAVGAMRKRDWVSTGALMNRNHGLLNALGVGHPALDKLVEAARPSSYGAKLTGAGGGGSMLALTDRPEKTVQEIRKAGGKAYKVKTGERGLEAW